MEKRLTKKQIKQCAKIYVGSVILFHDGIDTEGLLDEYSETELTKEVQRIARRILGDNPLVGNVKDMALKFVKH